jgi:hypothetical protein
MHARDKEGEQPPATSVQQQFPRGRQHPRQGGRSEEKTDV